MITSRARRASSAVTVIAAVVLLAIAALVGIRFQSPPYRLDAPNKPSDQVALDHRDSVYTSITWIAAPSDNSIEMRFFDRVEGGICLRPTWPDLAALAATKPDLKHLVPGAMPVPLPGDPKLWPADLAAPNPGTLTHTKYVNLYPVGVLLNDRLMAAAGGDPRQAKPKVLIVGLGSGIGMAVFAHHFPHASITVVDIDQVVIDMVKDRYPLLQWLSTQRTADGRPRMRFVARDARQFMRFEAKEEAAKDPYDLVVLDAYTAGSTIPPHLMTKEFFEEIVAVIEPTAGMIQANIIGSYLGDKRKVVGGAIRAFRAAGLGHLHSFPVLQSWEVGESFDRIAKLTRNNLVVAARRPLAPRTNIAGWERLARFVPYPELPVDQWVTRSVTLFAEGSTPAAHVPWSVIEKSDPGLLARFSARQQPAAVTHLVAKETISEELIAAVLGAIKAHYGRLPAGWTDPPRGSRLFFQQYDWVRHARDAYAISLAAAKDITWHSGDALVGEPDRPQDGLIRSAPLFTDQRANADIYNSE